MSQKGHNRSDCEESTKYGIKHLQTKLIDVRDRAMFNDPCGGLEWGA